MQEICANFVDFMKIINIATFYSFGSLVGRGAFLSFYALVPGLGQFHGIKNIL